MGRELRCSKCGEVKAETEFYYTPGTKRKRSYYCKPCMRNQVRTNRARNEGPDVGLEKATCITCRRVKSMAHFEDGRPLVCQACRDEGLQVDSDPPVTDVTDPGLEDVLADMGVVRAGPPERMPPRGLDAVSLASLVAENDGQTDPQEA